ncbi:PRTRC system protein A [Robbsia andropogonis]|uniref:PRTRC system protein A n=1 Tax=Robbsia andropogonis TaxID=28092 RepID=UPI002A6B3169|nr:PRTRC system protein A [Robbsia andropogonis]
MNIKDVVLQESFPSVMVPRFEAVTPMARLGDRLLIARNGIFLELRRAWLHLVAQIGSMSALTSIPYGDVRESHRLLCGPIAPVVVDEFVDFARAHCDVEVGAWIVWSPSSGRFRLAKVGVLEHSADFLSYEPPALFDDEVLVVDCHSHARAPAFFSSVDNADDRFDVKLALVVGCCDQAQPTMVLRLCAKGIVNATPEIPAAWYGKYAGGRAHV